MADDPSDATFGGLPIDGTMGVSIQGTPKFDLTSGTLNIGTVVASGTTVISAGTVVVTAGTIQPLAGTVTMTSGYVTAGTIQPLAGTVTVTAGTIQPLAGTIAAGTIQPLAGTIAAGTIQPLAGTVTVTAGTIQPLAGTVTLTAGSVTITSGTVSKFMATDGTAYNFKVADGKPRVSTMPYLYDVAEGNVDAHTPFAKIGWTPTLTTAESDIWSKAGVYTFPAAGQIMTVSSSHAGDTAAGSGVRTVCIDYLDETYAQQYGTVTLNGTALVNTAGSVFRVNDFYVLTAGSVSKAVGNISLTDTTGTTTTYGYITAGYTRARAMVYTVPAGKTLYVVSMTASYGYTAANAVHFARLYTRASLAPGGTASSGAILYPYTEVVCANTSQFAEFIIPTKIPEKCDIKMSGSASVAGIAAVTLRGWIE